MNFAKNNFLNFESQVIVIKLKIIKTNENLAINESSTIFG